MFKHCPKCGEGWHGHSEFLSDPYLLFLGYQASLAAGLEDFFLFSHSRCGRTLALPLEAFVELSSPPVLEDSRQVRESGDEVCLARRSNKPCPHKCSCGFVARTSGLIEGWPRDSLC